MKVKIGKFTVAEAQPMTIISGPCVIENEKMIMHTAETIKRLAEKFHFQFIFKSSYRKANRTSLDGFTGLAFEEALGVLEKVRRELDVPILTDVHSELEIPVVAQVVDVLQIPAFLCRQTDLLLAAGRSRRAVNIKKGVWHDLPFLLCEKAEFIIIFKKQTVENDLEVVKLKESIELIL